ncbi:hypothetical protein F4804DRAFT_45049 [Jackrogersella minutella]|nr:hypothetical protein F4804DRAFT_45049 [Jackrogersella minutella]
MGLAGPRNRRKIQHDPNNTKWSRDETTFGQRILRAQGWEPGKFLGAQNAAHSHLHSAASAAPINVVMKDDTMGLGAKIKHKQNAECTGLDGFKDLLGRLNGKSEATIKKERDVRTGIKTNLYVERKYGLMRFVSGGLLVGDQMKESSNKTAETLNPVKKEDDESTTVHEDIAILPLKKQKKEKKSKKRKAEESDSVDGHNAIPEKKRKKRSKDEGSQDDSTSSREAEESTKKSKKSKSKDHDNTESAGLEKKKKKKKSKKSKRDPEREMENDDTPVVSEDTRIGKSMSKGEKKEKKREKKAKRQKQLDTPDSSTEAAASTDTSTPAPLITPQGSGVPTPAGTGTSTPQGLSGRHYARSRNIASKRMAMTDLAALNQIFMIKPV